MEKSTRQKGIDYQKWIAKWILKEFPEAVVHNLLPIATMKIIVDPKTKERRQIWVSRDLDLFNCIDLVVVLPHCPKIIYIQALHGYELTRKAEKIQRVPWNFDHATVHLWRKIETGRHIISQARWKEGKQIEFYKIGEIKRGKYIPVIGNTLCDGRQSRVEAL